jgi:methylenetetrahydrofolate dehydrogenase (NADP+)/methenyltetrahydrofolate cyclohydrolase
MVARVIDGKTIAAELRGRVTAAAAAFLAARGRKPGLAVVLVGDDPASQIYVGSKVKQSGEAGLESFEHRLPASVSEQALLDLVARLNADEAVDGILVQLPLPAALGGAATRVTAAIAPAKDVDGLNPINAGRLASGLAGLVPCTPLGAMMLVRRVHATLDGLDAVVVGRSNLVGKPIAQLLLQANTTVTIAHSKTRDLPAVCRRADILVAAAGRPEMVEADWVKPGATVIDVGINRIAGLDGKAKLVGDVAFAEVRKVAGAITPVPGGVGPMTVACLLANTLTAACARAGLAAPSFE